VKIGPVEWLVAATGAGLVLAAVTNVNPLDVFRDVTAGAGSSTPGADQLDAAIAHGIANVNGTAVDVPALWAQVRSAVAFGQTDTPANQFYAQRVAAAAGITPAQVIALARARDTSGAAASSTAGAPARRPLYTPSAPASSGAASYSPTASSATDPPNLVGYTNPSVSAAGDYAGDTIRVAAPARAGLDAWGRAFGRPIVITDGYRSTAQQAASHAAHPERFAPAGHSWHERGMAVDVHLAATGIANARKGDAAYDRLVVAAETTGWCLSAYPNNSGTVEPWHFSYGGCG
jgi:hypothetical protein